MKYWIKRLARIVSIMAFFIVLFNGVNLEDPFNTTVLVWAICKAMLAAFFLWIAGIIMSDVILKGVVEDIAENQIEKLEEGLMQHVRIAKSKPSIEVVATEHPSAPSLPAAVAPKKG